MILPTGEILIVGGSRKIHDQTDITAPVLEPELYNPGVNWSAIATTTLLSPGNAVLALNGLTSNPTPRLYHSVALLLPDGRVFVGGGESSSQFNPQVFPDAKYTCEVFSPPYFQLAGYHKPVFTTPPTGPFVTNDPGSTTNTFALQVTTAPSGTTIDKVVLLRPGSVTHHFDYCQRYIELEIQSDLATPSGQHALTVVSPSYTLAPLGWYLLFVIEADNASPDKRVPSTGELVFFGQ